jgi:hypothetical protein
MKRIFSIMILSGFILATFAADILTLNNEMAFEGKIKKLKVVH